MYEDKVISHKLFVLEFLEGEGKHLCKAGEEHETFQSEVGIKNSQY